QFVRGDGERVARSCRGGQLIGTAAREGKGESDGEKRDQPAEVVHILSPDLLRPRPLSLGLSESRPKLENPGVAAVHEFRHTHSRSPPELNPQIHLQRYAVGKIYPDYVDFRDSYSSRPGLCSSPRRVPRVRDLAGT